jgi:hypothetical protein
MAKELKPIDASEVPELLSIAREVRESGEARIIRSNGEDLVIITPIKAGAKRSPSRRRKGGILTKEDSLWNIVGVADRPGDRITDISENKHKYLAEAYADTHE